MKKTPLHSLRSAKRKLSSFALIALVAIIFGGTGSRLYAAVLTWDAAPLTNGEADGPGTWNTSGSNWLTGGTTTASNTTWVQGDDAWIGNSVNTGTVSGTTGAADVLSLTTATPITVGNLWFNNAPSGAPGISGTGSLTITGTVGADDGNGSTIGSNVTTTFTNGLTFGNLTIGGIAETNLATLTISGSTIVTGNIAVSNGTLKLTGTESGATNINVSGGTLTLGGSSAITGSVNVTGGTLDLTTAGYSSTGWVNITDSNGVIKVTGNSLPSFSGTFGLSGGSLRTSGTYVGALGTGAGQLQITGGAISGNGSGASAGTFDFTVGGTAGGTMVWGVGGFAPTTNFNFGVTGPNGNTTLLNAIDLNVASGTTTRTISFGGNGTAFQVLAGNIINSGSATGVANLTLTAANGNTQNNNLTTFVISGSNTYNGATILNGGARYQLGTGSNSSLTNTTSISLTGNSQFAIDISGTTTISAPISSSGSTSGYQSLNNPGITVMTIGPGTVILTGSSSYTGGTLVGAGILQIGNGGTSGYIPTTSAISGSAGATLAYDLSSNTTASGTISGGLGLSQIGTGMLTLNGGANQNYTGATTISSGTLQLGDGTNDGSISGSGTIANSATLIFNNVNAETYAGVITGGGAIIKNNTGTQKISGSNNYTGSTTVNLGTLQLGNAAALGNTSGLLVGTSGTVNFSNGSTTQTTTLTGSGTTLTLAGGSVITGSGANAIGSGGSTLIFGVGNGVADQLVLTGGATASLTGTTTILLSVSGTGVSNYTIMSSGTGLGASLEPGGSGAPSFVLGALPSLTTGFLTQSATSIQLTFSAINTVYWTGGNVLPATAWNTPGSPGENFTSDAAGNNPLNAMFGVAQDVIFSASNQSFQNATVLDGNVSAHSLTISSAGAVGIGSGTVSSTLTLAGGSGVTGINTGSNAGAVTISANVTFATAATPNITVMNAAGVTISGTIGGSSGVLVNGTGLLTLTGNNNFTGGLTLVSGTTNVNSDGALGASTGSVTFNPSGSNAVLQAATSFATGTNRNFIFSTGTGTIDTQANTLTINGLISGGAALNKVGAGTLVLTGSDSGFSGVATVSSGTLQIQNPAWLGTVSSGTFNTTPGSTLNLVIGGTAGGIISYSPAQVVTFGGNGTLLLSGSGNQLETGGGSNFAVAMTGGTIEIGSGVRWENGGPAGGGLNWVGNLASMQIDASGTFDPWNNSSAPAPVNIDALNGSGQINRSGYSTGGAWITMGVNGGSGTFSGNILNSLGTVSITKTGTGTQIFSGSNGYSGFTAVTGGTLRVTTATGLGFGDQTFVNVAAVSDHTTTVSGSATLDLSGAGTVNNAITLNSGSLINSSTSAATTLDSGIAGVTFSVDPGVNSPITFGTSGGSGTGFSGTAATNGSNMYAQVLTAGSGYTPGAGAPTVTLTQSGSSVGGTVTAVVSSLSLTGTNNSIGGAGNLIINAQISGTGGFSKVGNGTLTVSGNNIYSGATTITQGNLSVTNTAGSATGTAGVNLTAALGSIATLSGNGFIGGAVVTSATSASVGVSHLAPGVNVSGANNNFGTAGVLTLSNGLTIGNGTNLDYDLGPSSDLINVTGNLSLGSNVVFNYQSLGGSLVGNTAYDLINFTGSLSGSTALSSWTANGTGPAGTTSTTFAVSGTMITVTFNVAVTTPAVAYWQGAQGASGTGAWNTVTSGSTNFTSDATGTNNTQVIPGSVTNVKFTANSGTNLNTVLGQNFTINSLEFTGTSTAAATTPVTIGGTNTLTIVAGGTNGNTAGNGITVDAGSAAHTISSNVALGSSQTWTVNGSPLTVSGTVSDGGNTYGLTKSGTGTLIVSASETYTGATTVGAGTLELDGSLSGSSTVTVGQATLSGTGNIAGSVALTGTSNMSSAGTLTVASLGVSGLGNTISSGTIDATGGTTLSAGSSLAVNGTLGGGSVTTGSGSVLSGTGTITGGLTVTAGGVTSPGGTSTGVMTTDLAYSGSSAANFNVASSGSAGTPQAHLSSLYYSQMVVTGTAGQVSLGIGTGVTIGANSATSVTQTGSQILGNGTSNSGVTLQLTISSGDYATLVNSASTVYQAKAGNTTLDNYFVFNLGTGLATGRFTTLALDVNGVTTTGLVYYSGANDRFAADGVGNTIGDVIVDVNGLNQEFALSYTGNFGTNSTIGGNDIVLTAIPEPSTWGMILGGFGMLLGFQRLRKRRVGT